MNIKVLSIADNAVQIQIEKEDYSIADIVHRELLNVKHVKFTGVPPPHPLIKTLTVQVHTDGTPPIKLVKEALDASQVKVAELLKVANETFPRPQGRPSQNKEGRGISDLGNTPVEGTTVQAETGSASA